MVWDKREVLLIYCFQILTCIFLAMNKHLIYLFYLGLVPKIQNCCVTLYKFTCMSDQAKNSVVETGCPCNKSRVLLIGPSLFQMLNFMTSFKFSQICYFPITSLFYFMTFLLSDQSLGMH